MRELLLAQDGVVISYAEALLNDAGIEFTVLDRHFNSTQLMSGDVPQRIMVGAGEWHRARRLLIDADLKPYLVEERS